MKRIAIIINDPFADSEYTEPARAFRDNGHHLTHVLISSRNPDDIPAFVKACLKKLES